MEDGPFDSCDLIRFPFLFYFKNPPAHPRVRIAQPGITGAVITPATKPSIKREEGCGSFPGLRVGIRPEWRCGLFTQQSARCLYRR